jgi:hypothetical protein
VRQGTGQINGSISQKRLRKKCLPARFLGDPSTSHNNLEKTSGCAWSFGNRTFEARFTHVHQSGGRNIVDQRFGLYVHYRGITRGFPYERCRLCPPSPMRQDAEQSGRRKFGNDQRSLRKDFENNPRDHIQLSTVSIFTTGPSYLLQYGKQPLNPWCTISSKRDVKSQHIHPLHFPDMLMHSLWEGIIQF